MIPRYEDRARAAVLGGGGDPVPHPRLRRGGEGGAADRRNQPGSKLGRQARPAAAFVDATGDGDLAAQAGCAFAYGRGLGPAPTAFAGGTGHQAGSAALDGGAGDRAGPR